MTTRTIAGTVNSDGSIRYGQEYTVQKVSTGHYFVSFRPAFAQMGGGAATQIFPDGDTRDNVTIVSLTANDSLLKTGDGNGNAQDRDFTFSFSGEGNIAPKV